MVKTDPPPSVLVGLSTILGFALLAQALYRWDDVRTRSHALPAIVAGLALGLSLLAAGAVIQRYAGRQIRIEAARQAAAHGNRDAVPLAADQPEPPADHPHLPLAVVLRPRWTRVAAQVGLALAGAEYSLYLCALYINATPLDALGYSAPSVVLIGGIIAVLAAWNGARQRLEVSAHGLTVLSSASPQDAKTIRWHEARLFAVYPRGPRSAPPIWYELSGPTTIIRFARIRRPMPFVPFSLLGATKPVVPFEEYDRQMEAVLGLIAAKTGLLLYDLRQV